MFSKMALIKYVIQGSITYTLNFSLAFNMPWDDDLDESTTETFAFYKLDIEQAVCHNSVLMFYQRPSDTNFKLTHNAFYARGALMTPVPILELE